MSKLSLAKFYFSLFLLHKNTIHIIFPNMTSGKSQGLDLKKQKKNQRKTTPFYRDESQRKLPLLHNPFFIKILSKTDLIKLTDCVAIMQYRVNPT